MKLSAFIKDNIEPILQEWENFASTIFPSAEKNNTQRLRDHAKKILLVIATDLNQSQTKSEQTAKSQGLSPQIGREETPAEKHGSARLEDGFDINEMVSEFRALRASVTKLFREAAKEKIQPNDFTDLVRFNESIDQAITESVDSYSFATEQQSRLFETLLSSSPDLSYILDLKGKFLYINRAMIELYPVDIHEILGTDTYHFTMPEKDEVLTNIQHIIKTGQRCHGEIVFQTVSGDTRSFEYIYAPVFDKYGKIEAIACASRDVTERRSAEAQIWQSANYDSLTKLVNRRLFHEKLTQMLKRSKRSGKFFALLFIDLDKFKNVNDTLGHSVGDLILKQTAKRINACVRDTDTVARMGGDEFTVILEEVHDVDQVKLIAEKILAKLQKPFLITGNKINISASIGITLSPQDGVSREGLIRNADRSMYIAKNEGGNRLSFYKNIS